jgi:hypothetical protein
LKPARDGISLGFMPRKPPARRLHPLAPKLAAMISAEVKARSGPNASFEEEQDLAAAVTAEALAELTKRNAKAGG